MTKHSKKTSAYTAGAIVTAAGALVGGLFVKKKASEDAFRRALVKGIRDVAGSKIARDPHQVEEEPCLVQNI